MLIRNSRSPVGYVYLGIVLDHLKKCHLTYTDDKLVWWQNKEIACFSGYTLNVSGLSKVRFNEGVTSMDILCPDEWWSV